MEDKLKFDATEVRHLIAKTLSAQVHAPGPHHLSDPSCWEKGVKPHPMLGFAMPNQIDLSKIKPYLILWHGEDGVSLNSSAVQVTDRIYAENAGPCNDWLETLGAVGCLDGEVVLMEVALANLDPKGSWWELGSGMLAQSRQQRPSVGGMEI